jgi:cellobiose phosphorylase
LDEQTSFIEAPLLKENQEDLYISPSISSESASIYEHCLRAMNRSMKTGVHGLPLMGAGDWNDGMNNVGLEGRGESVWVAWFLSKILQDFSGICFMRGDTEMAQKYADHSKFLTESIEKNAWDGQWYLRAFFDDGTPLGSKDNDECRIDSLTQSWSVLTGLGQIERSKVAMHAVYENLVKKQERLCLLFTPPFDKGNLRPGYIKGYPPGIRENGGQYSHAAAWSAMAFALMNEKEKAFEVLSFLNPVTRTKSYSGLQLYKLEPYALAADIYGGSVHTGRGGWSWYTGSSSLYYQAALEYILGVKIIGGKLFVTPCTPAEWKEYSVELKWKTSSYKINVRLENKKAAVEFDGEIVSGDGIPLIDDGKSHQISFQL